MKRFGTLADGRDVDAITLSGHGLTLTILTYGAIVQDVRLDGTPHSLTVGSDQLSDYEGAMQFHGCIVAPVANRLKNAATKIDGQDYRFEANQNGQITLHSGSNGAHKNVWHIDEIGSNQAILSHFMPNGHGGFPGNRTITVRFEILSGATMRLTITTVTDAPSIANATNHSYWNLDSANHVREHNLRVTAGQYLPTDTANSLVTGEVRDVANTAYDFRTFKPLRPMHPPLDHTFCVARNRRALTECLWLNGSSGVSMAVATTEAGVHVYDGRDTEYKAVAIETQGWPDAPNNANFPSIDITPDAPAIQITEWRFSKI